MWRTGGEVREDERDRREKRESKEEEDTTHSWVSKKQLLIHVQNYPVVTWLRVIDPLNKYCNKVPKIASPMTCMTSTKPPLFNLKQIT